jgi:hypothetical protein
MPNIAITALPVATAAATTDVLPIVQGGVTKQLTNALLFTNATLVAPALGTPVSGVLTNCTGSPTMTNPALGTPTSGVMTNVTGLPLTTGVTGVLPIANGGTGRSTGVSAYALIATGTTATGIQQSLAVGATTDILVGGGASALPVWTAATGTGAPVRAGSPTLTGTAVAANLTYSGLLASTAAAPTIASAGTIAPTTRIVFISGTTAIATITPPSPISAGGGQITLIPTGIFTTTTAGNIALASTAVVGKALIMTYDSGTAKWYPSY